MMMMMMMMICNNYIFRCIFKFIFLQPFLSSHLLVFNIPNANYNKIKYCIEYFLSNKKRLIGRVFARWSGGPGFNPRSRHTKDLKDGT